MTASAGVSGWLEYALLRRTLNRRLGHTGLPPSLTARLWAAAIVGAAAAWAIKAALPLLHPIVLAVLVLGPYGVIYLGMTMALRIPEARLAMQKVIRAKG